MDTSPIILGQPEGGRGCPSAISLWTREVFDVIEQCVSLPGEISRIVTHYMQEQLELFLLRMDEQGLVISSPWAIGADNSIVQTLWPRVYSAWLEKRAMERLQGGCRRGAHGVGPGSFLPRSM